LTEPNDYTTEPPEELLTAFNACVHNDILKLKDDTDESKIKQKRTQLI